jgi:predicted enzyme related to lactoylglutathione lyase
MERKRTMTNPVTHFEVVGTDPTVLQEFYAKAIERLGGSRVTDPITIPEGPSYALFADPEGHVVGIVRAQSPAVLGQAG